MGDDEQDKEGEREGRRDWKRKWKWRGKKNEGRNAAATIRNQNLAAEAAKSRSTVHQCLPKPSKGHLQLCFPFCIQIVEDELFHPMDFAAPPHC